MKLVAIVRAPADGEAAAKALAAASGLTLAEARMRLAPEPPALLARLPPDEAAALVAALRKSGLASLAVDMHGAGKDRLAAHSVSFGDSGVTFTPRFGDALELPWGDLVAILRGLRASRSEVERTEKSRRFSLGRAVVTGGLAISRTSKKTVHERTESAEQVIFAYARDGRAAVLAEHQLDFSCLGAVIQHRQHGRAGPPAAREGSGGLP